MLSETGRASLVAKVWMPGWICQRKARRLSEQFNEMFNTRAVSDYMDNSIMSLRLFNRINNLLPTIYRGLALTTEPKFREYYRNYFGRYPTTFGDLRTIIREIERLTDVYSELTGRMQGKKNKNDAVSFDTIVAMTEMMLGFAIDRRMKLYQFKQQYDMAMRKSRELETSKMKRRA
jgi:hypothetical protein